MSVTGVKVEPSGGKLEGSDAESGSESGSSDDDEDSENGEESTSAFKNSHRPRDESPNSKRVSFMLLVLSCRDPRIDIEVNVSCLLGRPAI